MASKFIDVLVSSEFHGWEVRYVQPIRIGKQLVRRAASFRTGPEVGTRFGALRAFVRDRRTWGGVGYSVSAVRAVQTDRWEEVEDMDIGD